MRTMPLESYVCGVVAAEMPAAYHLEALKAQAVAARTRAVRQQLDGGCSRHPGADICGDSALLSGIRGGGLASAGKNGAGSLNVYRKRVMQAVLETQGRAGLRYDGEPITVMYHAMSGGHTRGRTGGVFPKRCLIWSAWTAPGRKAPGDFIRTRLSPTKKRLALLNAYVQRPESDGPASASSTFSVAAYTDSGRVKAVMLAGRA